MTAHYNRNMADSRSTVDSTRRDNSRIRNRDSQLQPQSQLAQCQSQHPRQYAAQKRKRIHLPPMQLREVFSYIFPSCLLFLRGIEAPCQGFPSTLKNPRQPLCTESDDDGRAVATKEAKNGAVYRPDTSQRNSSLVSLVDNGWAIAWL